MNIVEELEKERELIFAKMKRYSARHDYAMVAEFEKQLEIVESKLKKAAQVKQGPAPVTMPKPRRPKLTEPPKLREPKMMKSHQQHVQLTPAAEVLKQFGESMSQSMQVIANNAQIPPGILSAEQMHMMEKILKAAAQAGTTFEWSTDPNGNERIVRREPRNRKAEIGLNRANEVRCSEESAATHPCPPVFCVHRAEYFKTAGSLGSFGQFAGETIGSVASKLVKLPICFGLLRAEVQITIHKVAEENTEGWVEYVASHYLFGDAVNPVVQMQVNPRKGDSLETIINAIEGFYQAQPEYEELSGLDLTDLPCCDRSAHNPWDMQPLQMALADMPGVTMLPGPTKQDYRITGDEFVERILCTAQAFTRLNTPTSPHSPGLCINCWRKRHSAWLR